MSKENPLHSLDFDAIPFLNGKRRKKARRQVRANLRQEERDKLSPTKQLARLDKRKAIAECERLKLYAKERAYELAA